MVEQAPVAAARVLVALGLEVEVAGARPGTLGDGGRGAVADDSLPAVDGVAGAVQPLVAQPRLIEREQAARCRRIAAQEVLVGARGLPVTLLIEALVRDVEKRGAHDVGVTARAVAGQEPLFGRDREAVATLPGIGPGQQLGGRGAHGMIRELARQLLEGVLGLGVARLRGRGVGVDEQRIGAPGRGALGHLLQHQVRGARELPQVTRAVVAQLEQAQRGLDQLLMLRRGEHPVPHLVLAGRVAVEHDLEVRRRRQRLALLHQTHAGQIGGGGGLGLERVTGDHRLVAPGRVGPATEAVEAARDPVLRTRRHLVLEVARQDLVVFDDRLGGLALAHQRLPHQELGTGRHVAAGTSLDDAMQQGERRVRVAGEEHRPGRTQLGLGHDSDIGGPCGDTRKLRGRATVVARGQEGIGLTQHGGVLQRRIRVPFRHLLVGRGGFEQLALRLQAQGLEVDRRRLVRLRAEGHERLRGLAREIGRHRVREHERCVLADPRVGRRDGGELFACRGDLAASQRVPCLLEPGHRQERALREALLPLQPLTRRIRVRPRSLERLDGGESGVVRERALAIGGRAEVFVRRRELAEVVVDPAREESGGGALIGIQTAV